MLNIGYACLALGVPDTQMKTCRLKNAEPDMLMAITAHNLSALETMLGYNNQMGIRLFRISSDIIPFASHPSVAFAWRDAFASQLGSLGALIRQFGMRVSMHPGQYTLLSAKDSGVTERSLADIRYHAALLDALGTDHTHKIVVHIGGVYGDKTQSLQRFRAHFEHLDAALKQRIVLENDDRHYHIGDVLETASALGVPAVYDNLHHQANSCGGSDTQWIDACRPTWDSRQKIHYSQQAAEKRQGAHSATIHVREFIDFCNALPSRDIDVMLEVKDKNLSAVKCMLCSTESKAFSKLEQEWSRYKYSVLEADPSGYQCIRTLLKDKTAYPAVEFYGIIDQALEQPFHPGHALNAAQHVWGYFKDTATESEKQRMRSLTQNFTEPCNRRRAKSLLKKLADKYHVPYLVSSYYFLFR
jgi:UV DNA damage endonuclease